MTAWKRIGGAVFSAEHSAISEDLTAWREEKVCNKLGLRRRGFVPSMFSAEHASTATAGVNASGRPSSGRSSSRLRRPLPVFGGLWDGSGRLTWTSVQR